MTLRHENGPLKTERYSFDEWGMTQTNKSPGFPRRFITLKLFSGDDREQTEQLKHPADILTSHGDRTSRNGVKS